MSGDDLMFGDEVISARASVARRVFLLAIVAVLGAMLVFLAVLRPPEAIGYQLFLLALGGGLLGVLPRIYRATKIKVILQDDRLSDNTGTQIFAIADVVAVERGPFAFKPSSGFLVRLGQRQSAAWQPGMWWRFGRRVGVGGVLPAGEMKAMAEYLQAQISRRSSAK